jgi:hypothetical protein
MHDDDDSGLFEGRVEITRTENGASFGLSPETYFRLASCAITAAGMKIEPALICRLPDGERGCKLVLFGRRHQFSVRVRVFRSCTTIAIFAQPLDGLRCVVPVYEGQDNDLHWSRGLRAMLEFESIAYYDSFWAQEQAEQQQGDGGDGAEAS